MGKDHRDGGARGHRGDRPGGDGDDVRDLAVFVPVAFMGGIVGKFFFQFGITVAVAVLVSLFVSFTLDPMLSAIWHDPPTNRLRDAARCSATLMRGTDRCSTCCTASTSG